MKNKKGIVNCPTSKTELFIIIFIVIIAFLLLICGTAKFIKNKTDDCAEQKWNESVWNKLKISGDENVYMYMYAVRECFRNIKGECECQRIIRTIAEID